MATEHDLPQYPAISGSHMAKLQWTQPPTNSSEEIINYRFLLKYQIAETFCKGRRPVGNVCSLFDHFILLLVADKIRKDYNYYSLDRIYHYLTSLEKRKAENQKDITQAIKKLMRLKHSTEYSIKVTSILLCRQRRLLNKFVCIDSQIQSRLDSDLFELQRSLSTVAPNSRDFYEIVKSVARSILKKAKFGQQFTLKASCYNIISKICLERVSARLALNCLNSKELSEITVNEYLDGLFIPTELKHQLYDNIQAKLNFQKCHILNWSFVAPTCEYYQMLCKICKM